MQWTFSILLLKEENQLKKSCMYSIAQKYKSDIKLGQPKHWPTFRCRYWTEPTHCLHQTLKQRRTEHILILRISASTSDENFMKETTQQCPRFHRWHWIEPTRCLQQKLKPVNNLSHHCKPYSWMCKTQCTEGSLIVSANGIERYNLSPSHLGRPTKGCQDVCQICSK